ncbi:MULTISPECIES: DUF3958 family protein [Oceanobacillus]|uniref:DUF3958 family protein n=1 Tax=Oceanobacillus TaxID=182709 RepID=UPI00034BCF65|nr:MULTISPECIES: DUF3958 family protein [Oceanobacillus]MBT2600382.1 DUF3958 family protein [Oceanobacillus sp. ISL-74]MBT2650540.1 DUF3958 family protein [Oceanobacillus sp. ISL-73]
MNKVEALNKQISQIQEEQLVISKSFTEIDNEENELVEIMKRNRRLFDQLKYSWHKDRELSETFDNNKNELDHYTSKISEIIYQKRVELLKKKKTLHLSEEDLMYQRRLLHMEGK